MALAIFDLDHTLINGDSNQAWAQLLCEKNIVDPTIHQERSQHFYRQYVAGVLNIDEFLEFALKPLKDNSMLQLLAWREQFIQNKILPMIQSKAQAQIAKHQALGDFTLIVTASNNFITEPIANLLQVDAIIATTLETKAGEYTGNYIGTACFQTGKISKLEQWLKDFPQDLSKSYFYSDSYNDLPLLEYVTHPVIVDADEKLTQVAIERNWPQMSFR